MLEAALAGAVAGYAIAIPVGAIAVLIIHTGLSQGLRAGLAAGAGTAAADGVYATIAALAGLGVATLIGPLLVTLRVVGGAVLIGFGLRGLASLRARGAEATESAAHSAARRAHRRTFLSLLGLTLLNPATVIYFAALTMGLPFLGGAPERLVFAAAAFVASLSWQSLLAAIGAGMGRGFGHRLRRPTVLLGNTVVIALGVLILLGGLQPGS